MDEPSADHPTTGKAAQRGSARPDGAGSPHEVDARRGDEDGAPPAPRWVQVSAVLVLVVVALIALALVAGGGRHGPGRHASSTPTWAADPAMAAHGFASLSRQGATVAPTGPS